MKTSSVFFFLHSSTTGSPVLVLRTGRRGVQGSRSECVGHLRHQRGCLGSGCEHMGGCQKWVTLKRRIRLGKFAFSRRIPITCGGHLHWARGAVHYEDDGERDLENKLPKSSWFINGASQKPKSMFDPEKPQHTGLEPVFPTIVIDHNVKRKEVVNMQGLDETPILEQRIPPGFR